MRVLLSIAILLISGAALAQDAPPPEAETVYSDAQRARDETLSRRTVQDVLAPVDTTEYQYARWKKPVCFNVYGLSPIAKYVVERRMKDIAERVGAPLDRRDPCVPNITIVFTADQKATLQSIADVRPWLVPGLDMIRSRARQSLPIQAWYATALQGRSGRITLIYDGYDEEPQVIAPDNFSRLNSGVASEMAAVTMVVDTKAVMGLSLGTLADHFALLSLAQARATTRCREVETVANLLRAGCDPAFAADGITKGDIALLTGLYRTPDDSMQFVQKQRIIGSMRRALESQVTGKPLPERR